MVDVSFIVMPFASIHRPSLGVSLLKAGLRNNGFNSVIAYFNLKFAENIGFSLYNRIAETEFANTSLIGELLFSRYAFDKETWTIEYVTSALKKILNQKTNKIRNIKKLAEELIESESYVNKFISECCGDILRQNPKLIGFTSTFHQNCASLSLAKEIKKRTNKPIIFGGANCEGEMGYAILNLFPYVDFICSGEGDISFIEFVKNFFTGKNDYLLNGIIKRNSSDLQVSLTNPVITMDSLPIPDFDDYFEACRSSKIKKLLEISLVVETSRGCWWGEKSQCTFCGLNGGTMKYRSKSVIRALNEIEYLSKKYNETKFSVVDNILDLKYIDILFPEINRRRLNLELFYETKANLSKEQLKKMKSGGVMAIQPGIESLSDKVLKLMKKGISTLQNIQLLKWCREIGILPHWNIIWGFPYESDEEYKKMADIIPLITHLYPANGCGKIVCDRFSPYFLQPLQNGMINVRPSVAYSYIYPLSDNHLMKLAYHFDFDYLEKREQSIYIRKLEKQISYWQKLWKDKENIPSLHMSKAGKHLLLITDTRPCAIQKFFIFNGEKAKVYESCDSIHSLNSLQIKLQSEFELNEKKIMEILQELIEKKLMICKNEKYLSLAISISKETIAAEYKNYRK